MILGLVHNFVEVVFCVSASFVDNCNNIFIHQLALAKRQRKNFLQRTFSAGPRQDLGQLFPDSPNLATAIMM